MTQNIISTVQIASHQCSNAIMHKTPGWIRIKIHQFFTAITYYIMAHCKLHVVSIALQ